MGQAPVYLITGSTGIAAATAQLGVQAGVAVFFTSRTAENCQRLFDELHAVGGGCAFLPAELTDPDAVVAGPDGLLRIMPGWESNLFGHPISWNIIVPILIMLVYLWLAKKAGAFDAL